MSNYTIEEIAAILAKNGIAPEEVAKQTAEMTKAKVKNELIDALKGKVTGETANERLKNAKTAAEAIIEFDAKMSSLIVVQAGDPKGIRDKTRQDKQELLSVPVPGGVTVWRKWHN